MYIHMYMCTGMYMYINDILHFHFFLHPGAALLSQPLGLAGSSAPIRKHFSAQPAMVRRREAMGSPSTHGPLGIAVTAILLFLQDVRHDCLGQRCLYKWVFSAFEIGIRCRVCTWHLQHQFRKTDTQLIQLCTSYTWLVNTSCLPSRQVHSLTLPGAYFGGLFSAQAKSSLDGRDHGCCWHWIQPLREVGLQGFPSIPRDDRK